MAAEIKHLLKNLMAMKKLTVQLQPEFLSNDVCGAAISALETLGRDAALVSSVKFVHDEESGKYINVEFEGTDIVHLWKALSERLFAENSDLKGLGKGLIIVCQGDSGWEDYLLLFHSDPTVRLDKMDQ